MMTDAMMSKDARELRAASIRRMSHPMYVVPVRTILDPSFSIRSHEELKAENLLVGAEHHYSASVHLCHVPLLR